MDCTSGIPDESMAAIWRVYIGSSLSRIFREVAGTSFREKQTKIRLGRASELLANTESKVVDVALESGYQSSSVFSELFKKHFGVSPGQWRRLGLKSGAASRIHL